MEKRRPLSAIDLTAHRAKSYEDPPPFLPPRRPATAATSLFSTISTLHRPASTASSRTSTSRRSVLPCIPDGEHDGSGDAADCAAARAASVTAPNRHQEQLQPRAASLRLQHSGSYRSMKPSGSRKLSRRHTSTFRGPGRRLSDDEDVQLTVHPSLLNSSKSVPVLRSDLARPHSHPPAIRLSHAHSTPAITIDDDPWRPLPLPPSFSRPFTAPSTPRPRPSFNRLSSLDHLIAYREEIAQWKRASSLLQTEVVQDETGGVASPTMASPKPPAQDDPLYVPLELGAAPLHVENEKSQTSSLHQTAAPAPLPRQRSKFRNFAAEVGFCFTIAMTQFLAEYLISGFALALPELADRHGAVSIGPGTLGLFWPATLLTLTLSATILSFARLADIYGGYEIFMMGLLWLSVWTLIPGFFDSVIILDVARAMQGLALAAFTPSTFVMVSTFYKDGPRKNFVLGLYSGCAPLGFFAGILTAGALPDGRASWYLWIASILACITCLTAYLSIPHDWTDRKQLGLKMDWLGALLITGGLMLVSYALAYEPNANTLDKTKDGFAFPTVYGPFSAGVACLLLAVWVEGWCAKCPLLPFDFFQLKSTVAVCLAALCFYASYGVWLYESANYFRSTTGVTTHPMGLRGIDLAIWYAPTAGGGLILCVVGASLMHIVPWKLLLSISGVAWTGAPLLLALCPLPLKYWEFVFPSMLCATLGIDLTFTISLVYFSSVQPKRYQGLCGAICSILVNLAMSFSLPISEIIEAKAQASKQCDTNSPDYLHCENALINFSYRSMFFYAAGSAGLGLLIALIFVRFPRAAAREKTADEEEQPRGTSSEVSTLVGDARQ